MIDLDLDRYENHKEALVKIHKESYELDFVLNELDIDYANKITGESVYSGPNCPPVPVKLTPYSG